jgi:hypothetical protein
MLNAWQKVFRDGIAPQLSTRALEELHGSLTRNDPALLQGQTTDPVPCPENDSLPVAGACPIALGGWRGEGLETVADVEDFFARIVCQADRVLGEPAAVRYFFHFTDAVDRETFRREILAEVNRALAHRSGKSGAA